MLWRLGGYGTFLRPELGALLVGGYLILLVLVAAELFREREAAARRVPALPGGPARPHPLPSGAPVPKYLY